MTTESVPADTNWHSLTVDEALAAQEVDPAAGLTSSEVETRRAKYGANKFAEPPKEPRWQTYLR